MTTKTFNVSGMRCVHCKANVENALKALGGVSAAEASLEEKNVTVSFDESAVKETDLKDAVDNAGRYERSL